MQKELMRLHLNRLGLDEDLETVWHGPRLYVIFEGREIQIPTVHMDTDYVFTTYEHQFPGAMEKFTAPAWKVEWENRFSVDGLGKWDLDKEEEL